MKSDIEVVKESYGDISFYKRDDGIVIVYLKTNEVNFRVGEINGEKITVNRYIETKYDLGTINHIMEVAQRQINVDNIMNQ